MSFGVGTNGEFADFSATVNAACVYYATVTLATGEAVPCPACQVTVTPGQEVFASTRLRSSANQWLTLRDTGFIIDYREEPIILARFFDNFGNIVPGNALTFDYKLARRGTNNINNNNFDMCLNVQQGFTYFSLCDATQQSNYASIGSFNNARIYLDQFNKGDLTN